MVIGSEPPTTATILTFPGQRNYRPGHYPIILRQMSGGRCMHAEGCLLNSCCLYSRGGGGPLQHVLLFATLAGRHIPA